MCSGVFAAPILCLRYVPVGVQVVREEGVTEGDEPEKEYQTVNLWCRFPLQYLSAAQCQRFIQ